MSSPTPMQNFLALEGVLNAANYPQFETRNYLNGDDQIEYHCITMTIGALESDAVWMIYKRAYGGTNDDVLTREQLPDDGPGFMYSATDRATYFS